MGELKVLGALGPFTLTAYGLCVLAGCLLGVGLTLWRGQRKPGLDRSLSLCLTALLSAWAGARLVYVLTQLETILVDAEYYGVPFLLHPWEGGYTLYGAVLGGMLGVWIYARATHQQAGELFDVLVPGAALALAVIRLGEGFTSQGLGHYVEETVLQRFPFAVENMYGDWQQPVFVWEAAAALILCVVLLWQRRPGKPGSLGEMFLVLLGAAQIFLESHREDECIRFGFVRFTQIAAIVVIGTVFALRLRDAVRAGGWKGMLTLRSVVFVLVVALCILVEFALDKSDINNHLLYAVMAVGLGGLCWAVLLPRKRTEGVQA